MKPSLYVCAYIMSAILGACSDSGDFKSGSAKNKTGKESGSTNPAKDPRDTADATTGNTAADSGDDLSIETTGEKEESDGMTKETSEESSDETLDGETEVSLPAPTDGDKPEEFENLGKAEIIVVRRTPVAASPMSFFYYAEVDSLRNRGIAVATGPNMNPNFTVYPKKVGGIDFVTAIESPDSPAWNAFLAAKHAAIKNFLAGIEAKGLKDYRANLCRQFHDANPVISDPSSLPPQNAQLAVFLTVPRNGVRLTYELREGSGHGCGTVNEMKFATAVSLLISRLRDVVQAGHYWADQSTVGMRSPPCPAENTEICSL